MNYQLNQMETSIDGSSVYIGQYGQRSITLEDDNLIYQRGKGRKLTLSPMGKTDYFHVGELDYFRIQFERNAGGDVTGLVGHYSDGRTDQNVSDVPVRLG